MILKFIVTCVADVFCDLAKTAVNIWELKIENQYNNIIPTT